MSSKRFIISTRNAMDDHQKVYTRLAEVGLPTMAITQHIFNYVMYGEVDSDIKPADIGEPLVEYFCDTFGIIPHFWDDPFYTEFCNAVYALYQAVASFKDHAMALAGPDLFVTGAYQTGWVGRDIVAVLEISSFRRTRVEHIAH